MTYIFEPDPKWAVQRNQNVRLEKLDGLKGGFKSTKRGGRLKTERPSNFKVVIYGPSETVHFQLFLLFSR